MSKNRSTDMALIPGERLSTEMISLMKSRQSFGGRGDRRFLPKDPFESFNHEILDRGPAFGCRDFGSLKNFIREIDRRLHVAINTGILPRVKNA